MRKNKDAGVITDDDVGKIEGIKIKEVSALTNIGIIDVFKALVQELDKDPTLEAENVTYNEKLEKDMAGAAAKEAEGQEDAAAEENKAGGPKGIAKDDAKGGGGGFWGCCGCGGRADAESDSD